MSFPEILGAAWLNERASKGQGWESWLLVPALSLKSCVTLASVVFSLSPPVYLEQ